MVKPGQKNSPGRKTFFPFLRNKGKQNDFYGETSLNEVVQPGRDNASTNTLAILRQEKTKLKKIN